MNRVLVTGATGVVGANVVRELQRRGIPVRAFVRDPARAGAVLGDEVEIATGDFADRASIRAALDGTHRVLLCSPNHPQQVEHETNVIDAAAAAGIGLVVKIGANGARIGSPLQFWDAHGRIVEHLRESGLPTVVLQPSTYTSNLLASAQAVAHTGRLFAPAGDAAVSMIDPRDVAAVAALVLTEAGHEGRTYTLTGPAAVTYHDVAAQLSAAIGRPVEYVDVPDQAARDAMVGAGLPAWTADRILVLWGLLRSGAAALTTDVVRVLTGRDARTVREFARDHAAAFRA
jgi:uncharacterized protein YbjT (DUF2867 family)